MYISLSYKIGSTDLIISRTNKKEHVGNLENTQAQMRKGVLEFCILSIISKGEIYPSDIISKMKEARLIVVEGTLYPLLTRLKNSGLLTYTWVESTSGPPRKYYKLTPLGEEFLKELRVTWDELVEAVNKTAKQTA
jgi:PadR family transcriptional regulator PadR